MNRRDLVEGLGALAAGESLLAQAGQAGHAQGLDPSEQTIAQLSAGQAQGQMSADQLARSYLWRISRYDRAGPKLAAVLGVNPEALSSARHLDAARRAGKLLGPLHGIPILLKDNIETHDALPTTAGSLALASARHTVDAPVAARLRAAGALLLGKANLSEWANFRSSRSVSGWSAVGGQTRCPYDPRRNPSGSSAGPAAAAAANLCAAAVGSETDGSVLAPASICGLVGVKPTFGLVSGEGVVPITSLQDTTGPMTRTVADAALLLSVMANPGAHWDGIGALEHRPRGMRLGVLPPPASTHPQVLAQFPDWLKLLEREGFTLVQLETPKAWDSLLDEEFQVLLYVSRTTSTSTWHASTAACRSRTSPSSSSSTASMRRRRCPSSGKSSLSSPRRAVGAAAPSTRNCASTSTTCPMPTDLRHSSATTVWMRSWVRATDRRN
jgi:amidase